MKNTCEGCKYYEACGEPDRKEPCDGKEVTNTNIIQK